MERWLQKACALIDEIRWTAMQMAGLRNALEQDLGLDQYDRRILQLALSPAGKSAIGQIRQCFEAAVLEISAHLDGRSIHRTTEVLNSLRARIDERRQLSRSRAPEMLPR